MPRKAFKNRAKNRKKIVGRLAVLSNHRRAEIHPSPDLAKPKSNEERFLELTKGMSPERVKQLKKDFPILLMVGRGKDELEAALLFVIDKLVEDFQYPYVFWAPPRMLQGKRCDQKSLEAVLSYVHHRINQSRPEAFFYNECADEFFKKRWGLIERRAKMECQITELLRRRPKLRREFEETDEFGEIEEKIALIVGFSVGIRAAQAAATGDASNSRLAILEEYSIARLAPKSGNVDAKRA